MKTEIEMPDYKLAARELAELFATLNLSVKITGGSLCTDDTGWKHFAWNVTFMNAKHSISTPWKAGTAYGIESKKHPFNLIGTQPNAAEVLADLARNSTACEMSFADWCADYGYDTDSRKALETYLACQTGAQEVRKLVGNETAAKLADLANRL